MRGNGAQRYSAARGVRDCANDKLGKHMMGASRMRCQRLMRVTLHTPRGTRRTDAHVMARWAPALSWGSAESARLHF
eukprot:9503977-Pyramimonas_sp.AAC.1